jgi:hypothetical protein
MSPVGQGVLSLTKFYRLPELEEELASIAPGMTEAQVRDVLGIGHKELSDDLVLYESGIVVDDPLLQACRSRAASALPLVWVALIMADARLAAIVESFLTGVDGRLIPDRFNADALQTEIGHVLPGRRTRKPATNILSYMRDSGLVEPVTRGGSIVGIGQAADTAPFVRDAVRYILFRVQHLGVPFGDDLDDPDVALGFGANHWLNLTPDEFRIAYDGTRPDVAIEAPAPEPPPGPPPPLRSEVEVEANNTESYEVSGRTRTAVRREQPLVLAYNAWMRDRSEIVRLKFRPPNVPAHLYNDIYDKTRNNLIEGKADASRPSIRMAIGQLMDYRRYAPEGARLAVLTERRPHRDLEDLLGDLGIACIWKTSGGFVDNADGVFV